MTVSSKTQVPPDTQEVRHDEVRRARPRRARHIARRAEPAAGGGGDRLRREAEPPDGAQQRELHRIVPPCPKSCSIAHPADAGVGAIGVVGRRAAGAARVRRATHRRQQLWKPHAQPRAQRELEGAPIRNAMDKM